MKGPGSLVLPGLALVLVLGLRGDAPGTRVVLERLFSRRLVNRVHLRDAHYRARLEALAPEQVAGLLRAAGDYQVYDYLKRLYGFVASQQALRDAPEGERESATFIMGDRSDRFYANGERFFRLNPEARTEYTVTGLRSLAEVRDWLAEHAPRNRLPWGIVNIVVHTYEWGGMAIPVARDGSGRADYVALWTAVEGGRFPPLPDSLADVRTDIRVQGCAFGRDRPMLTLLSVAFGAADPQRPIVRSSRYFVSYETVWRGGRAVGAHQYLAEYWHVPYPLYRKPGRGVLVRAFTRKYPDAGVDWDGALRRDRAQVPGEPYGHSYHLPVNWLVVYSDSSALPDSAALRDTLAFVSAQAELVERLTGFGLAPGDLRWRLAETLFFTAESVARPAILAEGKGSVMCVQRELTEPDPDRAGQRRPVRAPATNTTYYGAEIPAREPSFPPGWNVPFEPDREAPAAGKPS